MAYQHNGITITFREQHGDFAATVAGKFVTKDSLKAMKKHIDASATDSFESFVALSYYGEPSLNQVKVTGIVAKRRGRFDVARWSINGDRTTARMVAKNSPANVALIKKYLKLNAERDAFIEKSDAELKAIDDKIVKLTPP